MGEIVSVFPTAHLRRQRCLTGAWTMTVSLFRSVTHAIDLAAHPLVGAPKVVRPALGKSYESLFNDSRAVQPLERTALWDRGVLPETYPTAL